MKKYSRILSVLLIAIMILTAFSACGKKDENKKDSNESKVNGKTYTFESAGADGEDITATFTAMYKEWSFVFKDAGVCEQTVVWGDEMAAMLGTDPVVQKGTYEEKGDTVKMTFKSEDEADLVMEFTIDSDTIKMDEDGSTLVFRLKKNS